MFIGKNTFYIEKIGFCSLRKTVFFYEKISLFHWEEGEGTNRTVPNVPIRNMVVGGVARSQHVLGEAADVRVESRSYGASEEMRNGNLEMARIILERDDFDQLILEECDSAGRPMWVHVSLKRNGVNRRQVFRKMEGCDELERIRGMEMYN